MSRLPDLERALVAAAARQDGVALAAPSAASAALAASAGLRERWRRLSRRGHVIGVLAGSLVLAGVATGSAQVAGLHPFRAMDRFQDANHELRPRPGTSIRVHSATGAAKPWLVHAYVARDGNVCVNGGAANSLFTTLECRPTDAIAQDILDPKLPGSVVESQALLAGTQAHPTRVVVYGLLRDGAPAPNVRAGHRTIATTVGPDTLQLRIDRSLEGLTAGGRALVASFPAELSVRLFSAEVAVPPSGRAGHRFAGVQVDEPRDPTAGGAATIELSVTGRSARTRIAIDREHALLDRTPLPVPGVSGALRRAEPIFSRPRTAADAVPGAAFRQDLVDNHARRADSHRVHPVGVSDIAPMWVMPGKQDVGLSMSWDAICLAGPAVVTGCMPLLHDRDFPGLSAVICSPGLDDQQRLLYGLVPPGVTRARLTFDHGAPPRTIAVRDVLAIAMDRRAPLVKTVTWLGAGKPVTIASSFPGNTAPDQCGRTKARPLRELTP